LSFSAAAIDPQHALKYVHQPSFSPSKYVRVSVVRAADTHCSGEVQSLCIAFWKPEGPYHRGYWLTADDMLFVQQVLLRSDSPQLPIERSDDGSHYWVNCLLGVFLSIFPLPRQDSSPISLVALLPLYCSSTSLLAVFCSFAPTSSLLLPISSLYTNMCLLSFLVSSTSSCLCALCTPLLWNLASIVPSHYRWILQFHTTISGGAGTNTVWVALDHLGSHIRHNTVIDTRNVRPHHRSILLCSPSSPCRTELIRWISTCWLPVVGRRGGQMKSMPAKALFSLK
jgi:hypothetical protein